jgi:L-lactate dehydrogenase complex protein LldG
LLDQCIEIAGAINLEVRPASDVSAVSADIVELVRAKDPEWGDLKQVAAWDHPLLAQLNLAEALKVQQVPVVTADLKMAGDEDSAQSRKRRIIRQQIIDAFIGITSADFCMADSATLVLRTRPGQPRTVSILPSIHIAVITLEQVIADLRELVAILKWDSKEKAEGLTNCMTFISGPSKTADIEATMVHGAHGPREVYLYVITNEG